MSWSWINRFVSIVERAARCAARPICHGTHCKVWMFKVVLCRSVLLLLCKNPDHTDIQPPSSRISIWIIFTRNISDQSHQKPVFFIDNNFWFVHTCNYILVPLNSTYTHRNHHFIFFENCSITWFNLDLTSSSRFTFKFYGEFLRMVKLKKYYFFQQIIVIIIEINVVI